jgi:hypothetical protein
MAILRVESGLITSNKFGIKKNYRELVMEAGGLGGDSGPVRKFFPALSFYKITKILIF